MKYIERKGSIFGAPDMHHPAHCISADYALGKGIAKDFNEIYCMREKLLKQYPASSDRVGTALLIEDVFNIVTKKRFFQKPTIETLRDALIDMKSQCNILGIKKIAMPKIGCGLDKLPWDGCEDSVSNLINEVFGDSDIEILVYIK